MFIDKVDLILSSGDGGAGAVSFRREKFVPLGGPDGGDGGKGGDVVIICDNNAHTLANFKGKKTLSAQNGEKGKKKNCNGKAGFDLELKVPQGTQIINIENDEILLDMIKEGQREILLKGGKGGLGNTHFKNSKNQRPDYAQQGVKGISLNVRLELKLIADVGLVGFPNAGKSTLITKLSNAKPQIASYEFTTLTPKLGLVLLNDYDSFVLADIPGIINGASEGKGLGLEFLKHIERTNFLLFVLDPFRIDSLKQQFIILQNELKKFNKKLFERKFAILINKNDICEFLEYKNNFYIQKEELENYLKILDFKGFILSASSLKNQGIEELKFKLFEELKKL